MNGFATPMIGAIWLVWFVLYRFVTPANIPDEQTESLPSRASYIIPMFVSIALVAWQDWPGWLGTQVIHSKQVFYWLGLFMTVAGLAISTWGRKALGSNWTGTVSLKVGHEIVRTGPYRWVRHPMYCGVLVAMLGTTLALGSAHAFVGFAIAAAALFYKSRIEEHWMERQFGESYRQYAASTWGFIPLVF